MTFSRVKSAITLKLKRDIKAPVDADLEEALYEALYEIATECEPSELVVHPDDLEDDSSVTVLRSIADGYFIKVPEYPDLSILDREMMIDEELAYPAIYLAITYLIDNEERTAKYSYRAYKTIGAYKANYSKEIS